MHPQDFIIDYFCFESGNCPFKNFLESLIIEERADILSAMDELKFRLNNKLSVSTKLSKFISDGIFELRVRHKNKQSRSLFFFQIGEKIVFTNGFIKKTEQTPRNEFEKAIKYKNLYTNNKE